MRGDGMMITTDLGLWFADEYIPLIYIKYL